MKKNEPVVERVAIALECHGRIEDPTGHAIDVLGKRMAVRYSESAVRKGVSVLEDLGAVTVERKFGPLGTGTMFAIVWNGGYEPESWAVEEYQEFTDQGEVQLLAARRPRRTPGHKIQPEVGGDVGKLLAFAKEHGLKVSVLVEV